LCPTQTRDYEMKRTFFIFGLLIVAGLITLIITSCSRNDIPDKKKPDLKTQTGNAVYVLDSVTVTTKLQSISEGGTLTFIDLPSDKEPETNDIICSAPTNNAPHGFLYRVKNISKNGGKTIIETQEVSLEEAIQKANVSKSINLDDHIVGVFDEDGNPLEYTSSFEGLRAGVTSKITLKIDKTFKGGSGNSSIKVEGSITLKNDLQFDMTINDWDLEYLKLAYTAEVDLKATVSGELKVKNTQPFWNVRLFSIKMAPITIIAAGVPIVVTPEIPITLNGWLNGTIKGEFTLFDCKNSLTLGVLYQNDKVSGIFEHKNPETQSLAERMKVSVSGEFKASVEAGVSLLLYNSRNASLGVTGGIYGKATLTLLDDKEMQIIEDLAYDRRYALNPNLKVSAGLDASVGATLKFFALKLLDYKATVTIYEKELFRAGVFPQFADISISDKTNNSAKAITTVQTPAYFNFIFPVSQHGICISQSSLPTIENSFWYNVLGELPAMWTNISVPVVSADFKNLQTGTTYFVCPYFINVFGTFYGKVDNFSLGDGDWVLINGVKWATRNVGAPGTFVKNPEDYGGYYQWNRGTTDFLPFNDYYNSGYANADFWLSANDPSPIGYRVPTLDEIQSLVNTTYVTYEWTTRNGIYGVTFTDRISGKSIFLPAAGWREGYDGSLRLCGYEGDYWSTHICEPPYYACNMYFNSGGTYVYMGGRSTATSIRSIVK